MEYDENGAERHILFQNPAPEYRTAWMKSTVRNSINNPHAQCYPLQQDPQVILNIAGYC